MVEARASCQCQHLRCQLNGVDLRLFAVLAPISVDDLLNHERTDQGRERDQLADGDSDLDGLARKSDQLCATGPDGFRAAGTIALAVRAFADFLETGQIFIYIPPQPIREILPGRAFRGLP